MLPQSNEYEHEFACACECECIFVLDCSGGMGICVGVGELWGCVWD